MTNKTYTLTLAAGAAVIWALMLAAKLAPYDANYAVYAAALGLSVLFLPFIGLIILLRPFVYHNRSALTYVFLFLCSPMSLQAFVLLYAALFGKFFKF